MKLSKSKTIISEIILPCDLCDSKVTTVRFYLQAKSDRKIPRGFYSDLAIRLCKECLQKALSKFKGA